MAHRFAVVATMALTAVLIAPSLMAAPAQQLKPRAYDPLPCGSVTPTGWFETQLAIQAQGLSGHLAQFWGDVMKSAWIGGVLDGGLHERTP